MSLVLPSTSIESAVPFREAATNLQRVHFSVCCEDLIIVTVPLYNDNKSLEPACSVDHYKLSVLSRRYPIFSAGLFPISKYCRKTLLMSNFPHALLRRRRSTSSDGIHDEEKTPQPKKKLKSITMGEKRHPASKRRRRLVQLLQKQKQMIAVAGKKIFGFCTTSA